MTQERTRALGRALMGVATVQALFFFVAVTRRSYLALAIPIGIAVGTVSGIAFWIGYTMATTDWDRPADYPPTEPHPASEDAPTL